MLFFFLPIYSSNFYVTASTGRAKKALRPMSCLVEMKCSRLWDQRCVSSLLLMTARQARCDYTDKPTLLSTANQKIRDIRFTSIWIWFVSRSLTFLFRFLLSRSSFFSPAKEEGDVSTSNPQCAQLVSIIPTVPHLSLSPQHQREPE